MYIGSLNVFISIWKKSHKLLYWQFSISFELSNLEKKNIFAYITPLLLREFSDSQKSWFAVEMKNYEILLDLRRFF